MTAKLVGTEAGGAVKDTINANIDDIAALRAQVTALLASQGNPPNNAYAPLPPNAGGILYSASAATKGGWASATSKGASLFGSPKDLQTNFNLPTIVALPWDLAARSLLVAYMPASAGQPATMAGIAAASACYCRRVALDANGAPVVNAADVQLPSFFQNGFGQGSNVSNGAYAMFSGVAASASVFKALVACAQSNGVVPSAWNATYGKYSVSWDGNTLTASAEGGVLALLGNNSWAAAYARYTYGANAQGVIVNNGGWLSIGTMGYDCSILSTGPDLGVAFGEYRVAQSSGACHDSSGGGSATQSYGTTTNLDPANRLTLSTEVRDAALGVVGAYTCRLSGKTWGGAAPSIASLSDARTVVQWLDNSGARWASLVAYNSANAAATVYGNNYYNAGNLGAYAVGQFGFAPFNSSVTYGLRKDAATTAARLMKVAFDPTRAAGTELYSQAADDIALNLLASVPNATVSSLSLHGMLKVGADLVVVYGRATVSVGGGANQVVCFVESFAMGT